MDYNTKRYNSGRRRRTMARRDSDPEYERTTRRSTRSTGRLTDEERQERIRRRRRRERRRRVRLQKRIIAAITLVLLLTVTVKIAGAVRKTQKNAAAKSALAISSENVIRPAAEAASYLVDSASSNVTSGTSGTESGTEDFITAQTYGKGINILGVGDNLIHEELFKNAEKNGSYDFTSYYEKVSPYIKKADIALVNQETPFATAIASPSGYPAFNTPTEDGDALIAAGFDIINIANNHILDKGCAGLVATLDYLDAKRVPYIGAFRNSSDLSKIRVISANGIKVAFLAFTETINHAKDTAIEAGITEFADSTLMEKMMTQAKNQADIVVVYAHWGTERQFDLTDSELAYAQKLVNLGADAIIGSHPHVLQTIRTFTSEDDGHECPVVFSCGNFLSGQKHREQVISGMVNLTFTKETDGSFTPSSVRFLPTVTHYEGDRTNVSIYPVSEYTEALAEKHGVKNFDAAMTTDYIHELVNKMIPNDDIIWNPKKVG